MSQLTVVTAATNRKLTTLDRLKLELGISSSDTDELLEALIDSASSQVESYCHRTFAKERVAETFRLASPAPSLCLSRFPLAGVVSVVERGVTLTSGQYTGGNDGLLYRLNSSDEYDCWDPGKTVITYDAGYVLPGDSGENLPADLQQAVLIVAKMKWFSKSRDPMIKAETIPMVLETQYWVGGIGGAESSQSLPADAIALLGPYRNIKF